MTPETTKSKNLSELEHTTSPEFRQVYINTAGMGISFYDASITFGHIVSLANKEPFVSDEVAVVMSWEHLKALHEAIGEIIEMYENQTKTKIRARGSGPAIGTAPLEVP